MISLQESAIKWLFINGLFLHLVLFHWIRLIWLYTETGRCESDMSCICLSCNLPVLSLCLSYISLHERSRLRVEKQRCLNQISLQCQCCLWCWYDCICYSTAYLIYCKRSSVHLSAIDLLVISEEIQKWTFQLSQTKNASFKKHCYSFKTPNQNDFYCDSCQTVSWWIWRCFSWAMSSVNKTTRKCIY